MQQEIRFEVNGREFELFDWGDYWTWNENVRLRLFRFLPLIKYRSRRGTGSQFPTAHEAHADAIRYAATLK